MLKAPHPRECWFNIETKIVSHLHPQLCTHSKFMELGLVSCHSTCHETYLSESCSHEQIETKWHIPIIFASNPKRIEHQINSSRQ